MPILCGTLRDMRRALLVTIACVGSAVIAMGQERPVPKDSARVAIAGCVRNRSFITTQPPENEPVRTNIAPGRRFRLSGPKDVLALIKAHPNDMLEVTGLVRQADLAPPRGIGIAGGRIRIGPGTNQAPLGGAGGAPGNGYNEATIDVEGWRVLAASCPGK